MRSLKEIMYYLLLINGKKNQTIINTCYRLVGLVTSKIITSPNSSITSKVKFF